MHTYMHAYIHTYIHRCKVSANVQAGAFTSAKTADPCKTSKIVVAYVIAAIAMSIRPKI